MSSESEEMRRRMEFDTRAGVGTGEVPALRLVTGLTVLAHPDPARVGEQVALAGLEAGREELVSRKEPVFAQPAQARLRPLGDVFLSRQPIRLAAGSQPGSVRLDCSGTRTVVEADGEQVAGARELSPAEVERGVVLLLAGRVVLLLAPLDPEPPAGVPAFGLIGESPPMVRLRQEIRRVAELAVPVLLRGETGTGKELVGRALHEAGPRRSRAYLTVNMAAVPPTLAASELFGALRGAFTGADQRRVGFFARAQGGTLFLDEIGETPADVQPLLLRALESGEIQPVGGSEPQRVDVRVIAATDADLEVLVAAGRFRAPLLHRLAGYEIRVPPLRERREDFGRLLLHFLRQELGAIGRLDRLAPPAGDDRPWLPASLVARLAAYSWPGNVRQLRNAARRLVVAGRDAPQVPAGSWLEQLLEDSSTTIPAAVPVSPPVSPIVSRQGPAAAPPSRRPWRRPEEVGEEELLAALRANRWRLQPTATQLGIARTSLYDLIERSTALRKASDLAREEIEESFRRCGGNLDAMVEQLEVSKRGLQRRMSQLGLL